MPAGCVAGTVASALAEAIVPLARPLPSAAMTERKAHLDALAVGALVVCCFLWGLNQVAAKAALPEIPALWQAAARSLGGAVLVWLWATLPRHRRCSIAIGTLPGGLLAGVLFAAEFACIFVGLQYTTASRMVVFIYIVAVRRRARHAADRALRAPGRRCSGRPGRSPSSASPGPSPKASRQPHAGAAQWIGDALGVLAGVLWGATTLAVRATALDQASAEKTLLYQLAVSALCCWRRRRCRAQPLPQRLSTLAWARCVPGRHRHLRQLPGLVLADPPLPGDPARRRSRMLTPVFGLLLGAVLLGEPMTGRLLFALAAVAAGIYLVNRKTA